MKSHAFETEAFGVVRTACGKTFASENIDVTSDEITKKDPPLCRKCFHAVIDQKANLNEEVETLLTQCDNTARLLREAQATIQKAMP